MTGVERVFETGRSEVRFGLLDARLRGSRIAGDGRGDGAALDDRRRSKPQSLVTSHQKEYSDETQTEKNLSGLQYLSVSERGNLPKSENVVFSVPRTLRSLLSAFGSCNILNHELLHGREKYDWEGRRVFHGVE